MSRSPGRGLLALLAGLMLTPAGPAQPPPDQPPPGPLPTTFRLGTHAFRRILFDQEFRPLRSWARLEDDPARTVLIVFGRTRDGNGNILDRVPGGLVDFVRAGGAVLIASDQPLSNNNTVERLTGARVSGETVSAPWDIPLDALPPAVRKAVYRRGGKPFYECLRPQPTGTGPLLFYADRGLLGRKALEVITNRPSYLFTAEAPENVLATLPAGTLRLGQRGGQPNPVDVPFAVAVGFDGGGRVLLLADHSVFINEMMLPSDTQNVEFADSVIAWLKGEKRDRALFVEDRLINARFDVPLKPLMPLIEGQIELADIANRFMMEKQDEHQLENSINDALVGAVNAGPGQALFGQSSPSNYYLLLAVLAAVGLLFYGLRRLRLASFKPDPKLPVLAAAVQRHAPTGPALRLRTRLVLEQDTLGDDARAVAQEWLAAQPAVAPFVRGHEPRRPVLAAHGGWWRRRWLRKLFWRMWELAYGESAPVSEWEFRRLLVRLDRLRDALAHGELRLLEPAAGRSPRIDTA